MEGKTRGRTAVKATWTSQSPMKTVFMGVLASEFEYTPKYPFINSSEKYMTPPSIAAITASEERLIGLAYERLARSGLLFVRRRAPASTRRKNASARCWSVSGESSRVAPRTAINSSRSSSRVSIQCTPFRCILHLRPLQQARALQR